MPQHECDRLIKPREADAVCGTSRMTRYRLIASGQFPQPIKLGAAVRFSLRECEAWVAARIAERDAQNGGAS